MSGSAQTDREIRLFRRRATWMLAAHRALPWAAIWLLVWGTLTLTLRMGLATPRSWLLWGGLGGAVVIMLAVAAARRAVPEAARVRALLDRQRRAGGLLMAQEAVELGGWRSRLEGAAPATAPRLRWKPGTLSRSLGVLALTAAYVGASFFVPTPSTAAAAPRPLDVQREVDTLEERLEVLEEQGLLEPERARSLEQQVLALEEEASGTDPGKTWEALDHLDRMSEALAGEAAEEAVNRAEQLVAAQRMAEGLEAAAEEGVNVTDAARELARLTEQAFGKEGAAMALGSELAEALAQLEAGGELSPEQLGQLGQELGERAGELADLVRQLREARLIDQDTLRRAQELAQDRQAADDALLDFLEDNAGPAARRALCQNGGEGGACQLARPGRGGVGRGRADAPMTWSDGIEPGGERFEEVALPPTTLEALSNNQLLGISAAAPGDAVTPSPVSLGGALEGAAAGGGSTVSQELLPRHRGAVRRYFDRTENEGP